VASGRSQGIAQLQGCDGLVCHLEELLFLALQELTLFNFEVLHQRRCLHEQSVLELLFLPTVRRGQQLHAPIDFVILDPFLFISCFLPHLLDLAVQFHGLVREPQACHDQPLLHEHFQRVDHALALQVQSPGTAGLRGAVVLLDGFRRLDDGFPGQYPQRRP
jgi:hypothetical protein